MPSYSLDNVDLSKTIDKKELVKLQNKISDLHHELYTRRIPVIIAYKGWDAAGKSGKKLIKRFKEREDF